MKMAYEFLKKLFGTQKDGEEPKAMTYAELEAAIDADKKIQVVDVKAGGYVAKEKLDAKIIELDGVKQQLADANTEINSYKEMDIDGIKKAAKDWEDKYNHDTQELNDKLAAQNRSHAEEMFLSGYNFTSKAARKGVLDELRSKKFQLDDNGTFLGAKEFMSSLMEDEDYKGAFVTENKNTGEGGSGEGDQGGQKPTPRFSQGAGQGNQGSQNPFLSAGFGFTRIRQPENNK